MVCPISSGKMAVLARFLIGDGHPQAAEEVGHRKLFGQDIYREFREANEPNLLDEEDMHMFGLKPLTDELHLVSCNTCKKPIMASQYVAHAEICRLLGSTVETISESDGPARSKKPPRKERKKPIDYCTRKSAGVDNGGVANGPEVAPQNAGHSTCSLPPPKKRPKFLVKCQARDLEMQNQRIGGHHTPETDDPEMMSGTVRANTCEISLSGQEMPVDYTVDNMKPPEVNEKGQLTKGVPAPLASKIYYSQRSNRLRLVLAHSYYMVATDGLCNGLDPGDHRTAIPPEPDPTLPNWSELCSDTSLGSVPTSNISNHLSDTNLRPQDDTFPLIRENFFSKVHSFAGDSGKPLSAQQPNGSVPVS